MWPSDLPCSRRQVVHRLAAAWTLLGAYPVWAQQPQVMVWTSEASGPQQDVLQALKRRWQGVVEVSAQRLEPGRVPDASAQLLVHVVLGARTLRAWADAQSAWPERVRLVPVLAALVPRLSVDALADRLPPGSAAVWLDQPPERFARLIVRAFPQARRVGVLQGMQSAPALDRLAPVLQQHQLTMVRSPLVTDPQMLFSALSTILPDVDVLLAQPDSVLFNPDTLQNVLITSYRQRVPLVGFAESHVRAGATVGLFTQPADVAGQVATAVQHLLGAGRLPAATWSSGARVAVNTQVAHSLGLTLPEAGELESWVDGGSR